MELKQLIILILTICCFEAKSQNNIGQNKIDTSLAKKITVSGFCLCRTTLNDLKVLSKDFKQIEVEEMDFGKKCIGGQDSRYENGKGYYSEKYPGLIFQKDQDADYISKIRLTKDFVGQLPDETPVNLKILLLQDIIKIYPALNTKWGSRGCSDYLSFSNDTIAFFVKIDKNKKPQYPIDEAYYLNKPIDGIDILISCYSIYNKSSKSLLFSLDEPIYFLDSIRVNKGILDTYEPTEIASVTVYKGTNAINIAGKEAKNGAIYIMTKTFARDSYWNYFKSKSTEYKKTVSDINIEAKVVYILNGKILKTDFESDLYNINDSNFVELTVITKDKLKEDYKISDKFLGVVIKIK